VFKDNCRQDPALGKYICHSIYPSSLSVVNLDLHECRGINDDREEEYEEDEVDGLGLGGNPAAPRPDLEQN